MKEDIDYFVFNDGNVLCNTGPVCPQCKTLFTPEEPYYFNAYGYDLKCDECDTEFSVYPSCEWSWETIPKKDI